MAEKTGISEKLTLESINRADLARINGVSTQYTDLLECAGVDCFAELFQVPAWIDQAETLFRRVCH
ncbi:MAG: DUF4332 domain-containing protein [Gammaproteobacteria bacterium]